MTSLYYQVYRVAAVPYEMNQLVKQTTCVSIISNTRNKKTSEKNDIDQRNTLLFFDHR